jgi:hypothetical protein
VNDDGRVFAGLDDFVQIDDGPVLGTQRQRAIHPHRLLALEEIPSDEIGRGEIFMAGDRDQRPTQTVRHVLDKSGLAASRRSLQHDRHPGLRGDGEEPDFAVHLGIVRLSPHSVLVDVDFSALRHVLHEITNTLNGLEISSDGARLDEPGTRRQT